MLIFLSMLYNRDFRYLLVFDDFDIDICFNWLCVVWWLIRFVVCLLFKFIIGCLIVCLENVSFLFWLDVLVFGDVNLWFWLVEKFELCDVFCYFVGRWMLDIRFWVFRKVLFLYFLWIFFFLICFFFVFMWLIFLVFVLKWEFWFWFVWIVF